MDFSKLSHLGDLAKDMLGKDIFAGKKTNIENHSIGTELKVDKIVAEVSNIIDDMGYTKEQLNTYFNPVTSDKADIHDFMKILKGQVLNPFKVKNPSSTADCSFFVVCENGIEGQLPIAFDDKCVDICNKSEWFGLFTLNNNSQIVVPYKSVIDIPLGKEFVDVNIVDKNIWSYSWGFFQLDKNVRKKIIKCNVDDKMMRQAIKSIHGEVMFL